MKKKGILALLTVGLTMVACESTNDAPDTFSCEVSRTSTTVSVTENVPNLGSYTSTVTSRVDDYGYDYVTIESEEWYVSSEKARQRCNSKKDEANGWRDGSMTVSCSGNTVFISEYDEGSLNSHERNFEEMCADAREAYESGRMY